MRIIGGNLKGRKIKVPRGYEVRPTSNRVREALFSVIGDRIPGSRVLDLFAGTGSLGLEALSRGASHVIFVEKSRHFASVLIDNLRKLDVKRNYFEVVITDAFNYLNRASKRGIVFDIIFIDPPYKSRLGEKVLDLIARGPLLAEGGLLLNEFKTGENFKIPEGFRSVKEKKYGDTSIMICVRKEG